MKQTSLDSGIKSVREDSKMKDRKKRKQREEVRKILAAIRDELANHRLVYEDLPEKREPVAIGEVIRRARSRVGS